MIAMNDSSRSDALQIQSVRYLGEAVAAAGDGWFLVGQDGGQSIDLGDQLLFVFADSLVGLTLPGTPARRQSGIRLTPQNGRFLANTAAYGEAGPLHGAMARLRYLCDAEGLPRELIAASPAERLLGVRFWPLHGLCVGSEVFLYYSGVQHEDQASAWGFRCLGCGLARLDLDDGHARRLYHGGDWCFWPVGSDHFNLGVQVLRQSDVVYVYASLRSGLNGRARLARVALDQISDPKAYRFLASYRPDWGKDLADSLDLGPCGNEYSVSFNRYLDRYLMIFVNGYDKILYARTAMQPWGPFDAPQRLGALPHRQDSGLIALGFEHPTCAEEQGKTVYISYCQPHFAQNAMVAVSFA